MTDPVFKIVLLSIVIASFIPTLVLLYKHYKKNKK